MAPGCVATDLIMCFLPYDLQKFEYTAPIANLIAAKVDKPPPGKR